MSKKTDLSSESQSLLEILRTRLNVLNTSVFLLTDKLSNSDLKTNEYLKRINKELERIRKLITEIPALNKNDK